jgi:hypothetical protein
LPASLILGILEGIFIVVISAVTVAIFFTVRTLRKRVKAVSIYMIATGTELDEFTGYNQKISNCLSTKDWEMAELWPRIIENKLREKGFIS